METISKLQPVFIIISAFLGVLLGKTSADIEQNAGRFIEIFLMIMLFFMFLGVDIKEISKSFMNFRFSASALIINFLWTPIFAFFLAKIFLSGQTSLQIGLIMLLVTPCTDWYLIFTRLANGNVTLASSILPLNLILQIILLPLYLLIFMRQSVSLSAEIIAQSIILVLAAPLTAANIIKILTQKMNEAVPKLQFLEQQLMKTAVLQPIGRKTARACYKITDFGTGSNLKKYFDAVIKKNDDIQFILLCAAIVLMFASQGSVLLANLIVFIKLLFPLIVFFAVNFLLALFTGKKLKLPFQDTVPLLFTTSARNSPVSLAIAVISFPDPIISLALVMGPLIELPILALNSVILKRMSRRYGS